MNTSPQLPPLPDHRAPRRHIARELVGLFLIGSGMGALLCVTYAVAPFLTLGLVGLGLCAGGAGTLFGSPLLPRVARVGVGYVPFAIGLAILTFLGWLVSPWTLLCALVLGCGVWLSAKEA
ncbi:hypothetical protein ACFYZ9_33320 [Streptomyces sp. NPDC001691]|uniref:hypothetical protein n=1 Tax=Streptomyces sp. NPDC001691 TaxID=3364600 RepID=UPI0036C40F9E